MINWKEIQSEQDLEKIYKDSFLSPQIVFKHSTTCGTSFLAKEMLEASEAPVNTTFHFLDLLQFRTLSNRIADQYHVHHQSPQLLLIQNGNCTYHKSHSAIRMEKLAEWVAVEK